jgi:hypothetical protein
VCSFQRADNAAGCHSEYTAFEITHDAAIVAADIADFSTYDPTFFASIQPPFNTTESSTHVATVCCPNNAPKHTAHSYSVHSTVHPAFVLSDKSTGLIAFDGAYDATHGCSVVSTDNAPGL